MNKDELRATDEKYQDEINRLLVRIADVQNLLKKLEYRRDKIRIVRDGLQALESLIENNDS